jgi:hypothetical protein
MGDMYGQEDGQMYGEEDDGMGHEGHEGQYMEGMEYGDEDMYGEEGEHHVSIRLLTCRTDSHTKSSTSKPTHSFLTCRRWIRSVKLGAMYLQRLTICVRNGEKSILRPCR